MTTQKLRDTINKNNPLAYISSITFNGLNFVCLDQYNSKVILLDKNFNIVHDIHLECNYSSICFDISDNCYWAISNNKANIIYQLDCHFNEINQIQLKDVICSTATGISYNYCNDSIWISFSNCIGYVKKGFSKIVYENNKNDSLINRAILSLPNCNLVSYEYEYQDFLNIYNDVYCENIVKCIPKGYVVNDICIISCFSDDKICSTIYNVCFLLSDKCSNKIFVMVCSLSFCKNEFSKINCECFEELHLSHIVRSCHDSNVCFKCCCCNSEFQVIQSIALEEAAIAHILNAEGEKIQKSVEEFESIDKLLCINESVKETIIHITQLETQLYLKLKAIQKNDSCISCCTEKC